MRTDLNITIWLTSFFPIEHDLQQLNQDSAPAQLLSRYLFQQINAENCCPVIRNGMVILIEVFVDTQTQHNMKCCDPLSDYCDSKSSICKIF